MVENAASAPPPAPPVSGSGARRAHRVGTRDGPGGACHQSGIRGPWIIGLASACRRHSWPGNGGGWSAARPASSIVWLSGRHRGRLRARRRLCGRLGGACWSGRPASCCSNGWPERAIRRRILDRCRSTSWIIGRLRRASSGCAHDPTLEGMATVILGCWPWCGRSISAAYVARQNSSGGREAGAADQPEARPGPA